MKDIIRKVVATELVGHHEQKMVLGHFTYNFHPLATVERESLFFGGIKVKCYNPQEFEGGIPCLYTVNAIGGGFICGLDLTIDGKVWESITSSKHDSVSDALDTIIREYAKTHYCHICLSNILIYPEEKQVL